MSTQCPHCNKALIKGLELLIFKTLEGMPPTGTVEMHSIFPERTFGVVEQAMRRLFMAGLISREHTRDGYLYQVRK